MRKPTTYLGVCALVSCSWISQGVCSDASAGPQKQPPVAQDHQGGSAEADPLSAAISWLTTLQSGKQAEVAQSLPLRFIVAGINVTTGPLRRRCMTLGEERADRDFSMQLMVKTADDANLLAECLLGDLLSRSVLPEGADAWSGKRDRRGKQAKLKVVQTLPRELEPERKKLPAGVLDPATRLVELRATDNRGISSVAVLLVTAADGKHRPTGLLVKTKFEH
jgi:hypothetical protein